jgi:tetratricopeptide (TPR) repeat protein
MTEPVDPNPAALDALEEARRLSRAGDERGAEEAFRRADELGSARGAGAVAWTLRARGLVAEAEAAARRADERGDARGALIVGLLLQWRDEFGEAEAALRRAEERGSIEAAFSLGVLLRERGDSEGADAALERACRKRTGAEMWATGCELSGLGDIDAAEVAWRSAALLGDTKAAFRLGALLYDLEDLDGAEAAWRQADEQGNAAAALQLGLLFAGRYEDAAAYAAFARATERGNTEAAGHGERLRAGHRHVARTQQQRDSGSLTLSGAAAQVMEQALRDPPVWLNVLCGISPGFGDSIALKRAKRAAASADPHGVFEVGRGTDPYAVTTLAMVYARAGREDIAAVRRIRARAEGDTAALRFAEQVARRDEGDRKSIVTDRWHRLTVAALENKTPKPADQRVD